MKEATSFMNIRPICTLYLITMLHGVTAYHINRGHDIHYPLLASGIFMEFVSWLVSGNHLRNRIVQ